MADTKPYKAAVAALAAAGASLQAAAPVITSGEWVGAVVAGLVAGVSVYAVDNGKSVDDDISGGASTAYTDAVDDHPRPRPR